MNTYIIKSFKKITILSFLFSILFYIGAQTTDAWWIFGGSDKTENSDNFTSIDNYGLSEIGVALNINIGTKFYEGGDSTTSDDSLYNELVSIATIKKDSTTAQNMLITKNLLAIKDYINMMKVDIKSYLASGDNRQETYDSLMNQLKIRYKVGYANSKTLSMQLDLMKTYLDGLDDSIDNIKTSMGTNFKAYNSNGLNNNIDDYLVAKDNYTLVYTYYVFCNKFLSYYNVLNTYNKKIITTLNLNETAIVNNVYVVIPSSGSDVLDKLNLIYDESSLPDDLKNSTGTTTTTSSSFNNYNTNYVDNSSSSSDSSSDSTSYGTSTTGIFGDPYGLSNYSGTIEESGDMQLGVHKYATGTINFGVNK